MNERYHYTACGLDYVYLLNGFKVHETPYGQGVSIQDADGLHEAIALAVISSPHALRGQDVRFLRSLLDISQAGLGDILGTSRATVARWEGAGDEVIPGAADPALRMFYALKVVGHEVAVRIIGLLAEIDEREHKQTLFEETEQGWEERKEAA